MKQPLPVISLLSLWANGAAAQATPTAFAASKEDQRTNSWIASRTPLVPNPSGGYGFSTSDYGPGPYPEIPKVANRAILLGTFLSARSVLSQSKRCVYTDFLFRVERAFESPDLRIGPNSDVTISIPGGAVETPDGETISHFIELSLSGSWESVTWSLRRTAEQKQAPV